MVRARWSGPGSGLLIDSRARYHHVALVERYLRRCVLYLGIGMAMEIAICVMQVLLVG